ncbi:hypothetical protein N7447_007222 [Penicillium robsamsonii]|uniref:uncharacterized protein n=1 Tax=Penicillium robsamsonii TaxID=1792511 RepID=UPI002546C364|nr:uncharacterized protein N7447_007222 [Penicillium robsamsonii]KAJ5824882.1 hypothetical protein N7447_007222 [Penicillium robsamsonii]
MRFISIAFMAIIGVTLAADKPPVMIGAGFPCKADGSAGYCASGSCLQLAHENEGRNTEVHSRRPSEHTEILTFLLD